MLLFRFLKWKFIDLRRLRQFGRKIHLYGIRLYVGLYGQGKTMALVEYLMRMRLKYGDKIFIATNFFFKQQDFPITDWHDLCKEYDRPVIFAYDEIQNDFNSRDYANFPMELLTLLTQNRKGHGKQVIATAQRYQRVDKVFRELCQYVIECRCFLGRLVSLRAYDNEDYEQYINCSDVRQKMKIRKAWKYRFVQTDEMREMYDSYQMLESAKSKEYMPRSETIKLL